MSTSFKEDNEPASNQNKKKENKGKQPLKGPSWSKSTQSGKSKSDPPTASERN